MRIEVRLIEWAYPDKFGELLAETLNQPRPDDDTTGWKIQGFSADKSGYSALLTRRRECSQ